MFFYISFPSAVSGKFLLFLQTAPEEGEEVQVHKRRHLMTFCSPLDISAAAMKWWRTLMALGLACQFFQFFVYVSDSPNCLKMTPHRLKNKKKKKSFMLCRHSNAFFMIYFPFPLQPSPPFHLLKGGFCSTDRLAVFPNKVQPRLWQHVCIPSSPAFPLLLPA